MNPLFDQSPAEVPLNRAPLDRVICQIRFPPIMSIGREEFVAGFQEAMRTDYPLTTQQAIHQLQFQAPGSDIPISLAPSTRSFRFSSVDSFWHLVLTQDFLAIETTRYRSREEFLRRISAACLALKEHINPTHISRLGIRYIDRLRGDDLGQINAFFRPEILGLGAVPEVWSHTRQTLTESLLETAEGHLVVRWGLLPKLTTTDPNAIQPEPEPSWILDLDSYSESLTVFNLDSLILDATKLAERIYTFFRWSVTDSFLAHFKG